MEDWIARTVIVAGVLGAVALGAVRTLAAHRAGWPRELLGFRRRVERARWLVRASRWRGSLPGSTAETLVARLDELGRDLARTAE